MYVGTENKNEHEISPHFEPNSNKLRNLLRKIIHGLPFYAECVILFG